MHWAIETQFDNIPKESRSNHDRVRYLDNSDVRAFGFTAFLPYFLLAGNVRPAEPTEADDAAVGDIAGRECDSERSCGNKGAPATIAAPLRRKTTLSAV